MTKITLNTIANDIKYIKEDVKEMKKEISCINDVKTDLAVTKDRQRFFNVGLAILNVTIGAIAATFKR